VNPRSLVFLAALLVSVSAWGVEVAGVKVEDKIRVGDFDLVLTGAGLRTKFVFKVYVAALYAQQRSNSAETLVNGAGPRRMALHMLREMSADTLFAALREGLQANVSEAEWAALAAPLEKMAAIFRAVGTAREGDNIALDFAADGVAVSVNGEAKGRVEGGAFARALLRVWLGEHPVEAGLKKALLAE
jgi:long-chain acyl-CoA synthetase